MVANLQVEWPRIRDVAMRYGVDPYFIAAIRKAENGGPGREFGIMLTNRGKLNSFEFQLLGCIQTIVHCVNDFRYNICVAQRTARGEAVLRYSEAFIAAVQRRYAPLGAGNDPTDLNKNWFVNVANTYFAFKVLNPSPELWGLEEVRDGKEEVIVDTVALHLNWKLSERV